MSSDDEDQNPDPHAPPPEEERPRRMGDTVRKALASGFRAARAGEEKLRGMVGDALPKEVTGYVKSAIDTGREEVVRIIGSQFKKFLEGIDVGGEVAKILTAVSFEIRTEIRFIPNDKKLKPEVKMTVRPKRADKPSDKEGGEG
ncbi:MAG: hypothetical protein IT385_17640 [Deltaproteobacteria bacterium]|nr:hypothetical protein [Deltaproteobacteria bacterium]